MEREWEKEERKLENIKTSTSRSKKKIPCPPYGGRLVGNKAVKIRPDSTSAATQVKQSTTEFETQTYSTGLNQQDMASQAVQDTMNTSVQAVQDIMSSSVQAVQDTMDTGVQAVLDKYQRMFHFNESGRIEGELDGEQFIMGEVESNIILKMMKNRMTTKR
ncbi:uncharacterized protein [Argopecten irradians]|uniref:uncharacterized protein n=1 Tax=Argopecten irradians TaxID=31199 RepID=UPI003724751A